MRPTLWPLLCAALAALAGGTAMLLAGRAAPGIELPALAALSVGVGLLVVWGRAHGDEEPPSRPCPAEADRGRWATVSATACGAALIALGVAQGASGRVHGRGIDRPGAWLLGGGLIAVGVVALAVPALAAFLAGRAGSDPEG